MSVRHAIFVVGNAGTGKSQVSVLLIKAFSPYMVLFSETGQNCFSLCSKDYLSNMFNKNILWQILRTLYKTYINMKKKPVWNDLNPKAISRDELFGFIHPGTREWKDGRQKKNCIIIFLYTAVCILWDRGCDSDGELFHLAGLLSCIMRDQANNSHPGPKWIILDGDVDPMWIESLNTVMDDNKVSLYLFNVFLRHLLVLCT